METPARPRGTSQSHPSSGAPPHLHGSDGGQAPSRRFARIEGRRRLPRGATHRLGIRHTHRDLPGADSLPHDARAGNDFAPAFSGEARRTRDSRGSEHRSGGSTSAVQCVRRIRRCNRAAGLCELRAAGRLRIPEETGHRRQRQDRDRALRAELARPEGQAGPGQRSGWDA